MSNPRDLFIPKLAELEDMCSSCPFRQGNDKEFGEIVRKIHRTQSRSELTDEVLEATAMVARFNIKEEVAKLGDFICHNTAYDEYMTRKDISKARQCPGATAHYKSINPTTE